MTQFYDTGAVSVSAGGTVVTGTTTAFPQHVNAGDILIIGGVAAGIKSVDSATQLTLQRAWPGSTQAGAAYHIALCSTLNVWPSEVAERVRLALVSAQRVTVSASDPTAGSGVLNDIWIKSNGTSAIAFQTRGASAWSSPVSLIGGVSSVAGRTGDVTLTQADISGLQAAIESKSVANIIANGSMVISQENGTTAVATGAYPVDQWQVTYATAVGTGQQITATPPVGYTHAVRLTVTTPSSSGYFFLEQPIEGFRIARLAVGTASALASVMGFWVRSSVAQTVTLDVRDSTGTARFTGSVTISAANTWEFKTLAVSAMTAGTWGAATAKGGSVVVMPSATWRNTSGATFDLTGFVWLPGSDAPSAASARIMMRHYEDDLRLCQRYYEIRNYIYNTTVSSTGWFVGNWLVTKRVQPAISTTNAGGAGVGASGLDMFYQSSNASALAGGTVIGNARM